MKIPRAGNSGGPKRGPLRVIFIGSGTVGGCFDSLLITSFHPACRCLCGNINSTLRRQGESGANFVRIRELDNSGRALVRPCSLPGNHTDWPRIGSSIEGGCVKKKKLLHLTLIVSMLCVAVQAQTRGSRRRATAGRATGAAV